MIDPGAAAPDRSGTEPVRRGSEATGTTDGSTPLSDRVVVVPGGRGFLGSRIVDALVGAGARVVVPTRGPGGNPMDGPLPGAVTEAPASATTARVVVVRDWSQPDELSAVLAEPGWRPDAAIVAIGGWVLVPPLTELDPDTWRALVESHLTGHFLALRATAGLLTGDDPVYITLNGSASREPMAGSGPICAAGAGQRMLVDVLRLEESRRGSRLRVHEVLITAAVTGDDRHLTPVAEVSPQAVTTAVLQTLTTPTTPPLVEVNPTPQ